MTFPEFLLSIPGVIFGPESWTIFSAILAGVTFLAGLFAVMFTTLWDSLWRFPVIAVEIVATVLLMLFLFWSGVIA